MRAIEFESRLRAIPQRRDDSNMASQTFSRLDRLAHRSCLRRHLYPASASTFGFGSRVSRIQPHNQLCNVLGRNPAISAVVPLLISWVSQHRLQAGSGSGSPGVAVQTLISTYHFARRDRTTVPASPRHLIAIYKPSSAPVDNQPKESFGNGVCRSSDLRCRTLKLTALGWLRAKRSCLSGYGDFPHPKPTACWLVAVFRRHVDSACGFLSGPGVPGLDAHCTP